MPRLLVFVPCQKVMIDQDGSASAISIIQDLQVGVPTKLLPLSKEAGAPLNWNVLSLWDRADEERTSFAARVRLILPSGRIAVESISEHNFENFTKRYQRVIGNVQGFPIGEPGELSLILGIRLDGEAGFSDIATYPIRLKYQEAEVGKAVADASNAQA